MPCNVFRIHELVGERFRAAAMDGRVLAGKVDAECQGRFPVDVTLTPFFDRYDSTDLKLLKMEVHQCFGTWSGRIRGEDGVAAEIDGIDGFAEEARNRW